MTVDIDKALREAIRTGRVEIGLETTIRATVTGRARLVIVSSRCPDTSLDDLRYYSSMSEVPIIEFEGDSRDLGRACRKPFHVASVAVIDAGESSVLSAVQGA